MTTKRTHTLQTDAIDPLELALKRLGELNRDDEAGIRTVIANVIAALKAATKEGT